MQDTVFSPSFGNRPKTLVGRDKCLQEFEYGLDSIQGSRERTILILGQRGTGKTVLLLEAAEIAKRKDYLVVPPTTASDGMVDEILAKLWAEIRNISFPAQIQVKSGDISFMGMKATLQFEHDNNLDMSIYLKFLEGCKAACKKKKGVLFLLDEVQAYNRDLRKFFVTIQELIGQGIDVAVIMAGLPSSISETMNDKVLTFLNRSEKIYLEPIEKPEIIQYYEKAFPETGLSVSEQIIMDAAVRTEGSPYLMQLIGHYIVKNAEGPCTIDRKMYEIAAKTAEEVFQNDVCKTILRNVSEKDTEFLCSMTMDPKETKISDVIKRMGISNSYAQLYKRRLVENGIIFVPKRGMVDFSVPYLKKYLIEHEMS